MSKYQFHQSDIYQPGTDLPINRLNIGDAEILHEIEAQLLQQAYQTFVSELTADTRFDEAYFRSLHQRTFDTRTDPCGTKFQRVRTMNFSR